MKHTPGPWNFKSGPDNQIYFGNKKSFPIFTVLCGTKEAKHNARLIAKAPELYEACKLVRPTLQQIIKDDPQNIAAKLNLRDIEAALAKIDGTEEV